MENALATFHLEGALVYHRRFEADFGIQNAKQQASLADPVGRLVPVVYIDEFGLIRMSDKPLYFSEFSFPSRCVLKILMEHRSFGDFFCTRFSLAALCLQSLLKRLAQLSAAAKSVLRRCEQFGQCLSGQRANR